MLSRFLNMLKFDPYVDIKSYQDALKLALERRAITLRDLVPDVLSSAVIAADVLDTGPEIVVQANVPGAKAENISIKIINNILNIKVTLHKSTEYKGAVTLHKERRADVYVRSLQLPAGVRTTDVAAVVEDGVLTLIIPKDFSTNARKIDITASDMQQ